MVITLHKAPIINAFLRRWTLGTDGLILPHRFDQDVLLSELELIEPEVVLWVHSRS